MEIARIIKVKEYLNRFDTRATELKYESVRVPKVSNEQIEIGEIVFKSTNRESFQKYTRIALDGIHFNYYVDSSSVPMIKTGLIKRYRHQVIIKDLKSKLEEFAVSNLAFNQFLAQNIFNNYFEVVERIRLTTPFEKKVDIIGTRVFYGTNVATDPIWKQLGYSEKCYNLLVNSTNVKELQLTGNNMFEALTKQIFIPLGGTPVIVDLEWSDSVLDVRLFDEETAEVNITNHFAYEEKRPSGNQAISAEVNINNLVLSSDYISGFGTGKIIQSEEAVLDEEIAIISLETGIYRIKKALVFDVTDTDLTTGTDLTLNFKSDQEFKILRTDREIGVQTQQNCVQYKVGSKEITGFGQTAKKAIIIFNAIVWEEMFQDYGIDTTGKQLWDYKFIISYEAIVESMVMNVKRSNFSEFNKKTSVRINLGERINQAEKTIDFTRNQLERLGARSITKRVKHRNFSDIHDVGTFDLDTGLKVANYELTFVNKNIVVDYLLTAQLNILSEFVGVNSENKFTDTKIGGGLIRQTTYGDYAICSLNSPNIENTSSWTTEGIKKFATVFGVISGVDVEARRHFLISGNNGDIPATIIPANRIAGTRYMAFNVPISSQTFVDNEITDVDGRLVERGVRYTDNLGLLDTLALEYGVQVNPSADVDINRSLPLAEGFIEPDDLVNLPLAFFNESGVVQTGLTDVKTITVENNYPFDNVRVTKLNLDWICTEDNATGTEVSAELIVTYTKDGIDTEVFNKTFVAVEVGDEDFEILEFAGGLVNEIIDFSGTAINNINIKIIYKVLEVTEQYNYSVIATNISIDALETAYKPYIKIGNVDFVGETVSTDLADSIVNFDIAFGIGNATFEFSKSYTLDNEKVNSFSFDWRCIGEGTDRSAEVRVFLVNPLGGGDSIPIYTNKVNAVEFGEGNLIILDFVDGAISEVVNGNNAGTSEIRVEIDYTVARQLIEKTSIQIDLTNVSVETVEFTEAVDNDGLFIDKNFNEIAQHTQELYGYEKEDELILGTAMFTKNPLMTDEVITEWKVYTTQSRYGKNDYDVIKGNVSIGLSITDPVILNDVIKVDLVGGLGFGSSYGVVGVIGSKEFLLYAVNPVRGETQAKRNFSIGFQHFNDDEVIQY